jgi:transposase
MVLPPQFKDQTKVTFDSIIKRAFKQAKDEIDKDKINLLEPLKKEDFEGLSKEEILLFKTEFVDIIKESKRRIRDNRQVVNLVCEDIQISSAIITERAFPDMNEKVKSILLGLRNVIKDAKKINRLINTEADKATENKNFDYNDELDGINEQTQRLGGMTKNLISLLN